MFKRVMVVWMAASCGGGNSQSKPIPLPGACQAEASGASCAIAEAGVCEDYIGRPGPGFTDEWERWSTAEECRKLAPQSSVTPPLDDPKNTNAIDARFPVVRPACDQSAVIGRCEL